MKKGHAINAQTSALSPSSTALPWNSSMRASLSLSLIVGPKQMPFVWQVSSIHSLWVEKTQTCKKDSIIYLTEVINMISMVS